MRTVRITTEVLSAAAFAPFGWLPVDDTDPADGLHSLTYAWGDPHCNVIAHAYDEVVHTEAGTLCTRLYRHDTHTQVLMPLNVDAIVAVAPAATGFADPADLDQIRAFHLRPLDAVVLHPGTWHWGPFPQGPEPVRLLNVQARGYQDDNAHVDLPEALGTAVEVVDPPPPGAA
ncbi:MAG: ureidoglycolate lyase [Actinomycetota bacterium]